MPIIVRITLHENKITTVITRSKTEEICFESLKLSWLDFEKTQNILNQSLLKN